MSVERTRSVAHTSIEKDGAGVEDQRDHQQENHFDGITTSIDEVTVEDVGVISRRQTILIDQSHAVLSDKLAGVVPN